MKILSVTAAILALTASSAFATPEYSDTRLGCEVSNFTIILPVYDGQEDPFEEVELSNGNVHRDFEVAGVYFSRRKNKCLAYHDVLSYAEFNAKEAYDECVEVARGTNGANGSTGVCNYEIKRIFIKRNNDAAVLALKQKLALEKQKAAELLQKQNEAAAKEQQKLNVQKTLDAMKQAAKARLGEATQPHTSVVNR